MDTPFIEAGTDWDSLMNSYAEYEIHSAKEVLDTLPLCQGESVTESQYLETEEKKMITKTLPLSSLNDVALISFLTLLHVTKEEELRAGAILLELSSEKTGEIKEQWLPKAICSNLDETAKTVYVWAKFIREQGLTPFADMNPEIR